jgi:hypothetical protein
MAMVLPRSPRRLSAIQTLAISIHKPGFLGDFFSFLSTEATLAYFNLFCIAKYLDLHYFLFQMEWLSLTFFISLQDLYQDPFEDWQLWQVYDAFCRGEGRLVLSDPIK